MGDANVNGLCAGVGESASPWSMPVYVYSWSEYMLKCVCISVCMHAGVCAGACWCGVYMMDSICYMMCDDGMEYVYRGMCMCVH